MMQAGDAGSLVAVFLKWKPAFTLIQNAFCRSDGYEIENVSP